MLKDFFKTQVLKPVLYRLGTLGAGALVFGGDWLCQNLDACGLVTADGADQVVRYVVAVALVVSDLVFDAIERRKAKRA